MSQDPWENTKHADGIGCVQRLSKWVCDGAKAKSCKLVVVRKLAFFMNVRGRPDLQQTKRNKTPNNSSQKPKLTRSCQAACLAKSLAASAAPLISNVGQPANDSKTWAIAS